MSIVCHYFKSTSQSYKIVANIEKKHKKITSLQEVKKTLKRTLKTSAVKLSNFSAEVGQLYTFSLQSILALCNRLKLRYVEFMLFSRCVLRISCFRFESMCFRVRWQWGSLHSFPKNIR